MHKLTIDPNDEIIDLGDAHYVSRQNEKTEYLNFRISRENLIKIAKSTTAKLKIGNAEFQFTPEHLKVFAALVKISNPSDL